MAVQIAGEIVKKADADLNLNMKTRIMVGVDKMTQANQSIFKWCDTVKPLLKTPADAEDQTQDHLMKILDEGIEKMNLAQTEILNSSLIFNEAFGKLLSLEYQFQNELYVKNKHFTTENSQKIIAYFREKLTLTEEFYKDLKTKASKSFRDIGALMTQTENVKISVVFGESLKPDDNDKSAENVIAICNEITKKTDDE